MSVIREPNDTFIFDNVRLGKPIAHSSTGFLSKYLFNEEPLYIQPPKCSVKQFITNKGKRMYCDLVIQHENDQFIHWIEQLQECSQKMIFKNKDTWFNSDIDMDDIENNFTSPLKIYKSGRSYIMRTYIQSSLGKPQIKIYDENGMDVSYEDISADSQIKVILEFSGIRCSTRSFHIEIEIKQIMVMKPNNLFNSCIMKQNDTIPMQKLEQEQEQEEQEQEQEQEEQEQEKEEQEKEEQEKEEDKEDKEEDKEEDKYLEQIENPEIKIDTTQDEMTELCEVDISLDNLGESISIKEKNDVYYKMYQDAREKAKVARDLALSAYLEAKQIKNTYMLDIDSESESDTINTDSDEE
jgi:hypothetical protein